MWGLIDDTGQVRGSVTLTGDGRDYQLVNKQSGQVQVIRQLGSAIQ